MSRPTYRPPPPDHEPHKILIKRGEFVDSSRGNRVVPFKIYHPVAHSLAHLPVVIWSHGLGGNANGAAFLARFVSSHGYVVVNMQHPGTDSSLWEGKPGHPWDVIRATPIPRSASLDRFRDVPFVLDSLQNWARDHPDVAEHMDTSRIGMCGHSFGALTTQVMAGQMFPDESGTLVSFPEPRFRAGILYSPVPIRHLSDAPDAEIYSSVSLPLLHMTGTQDDSPVEKFGYEQRLAVFENAKNVPQSLMVLEDGDHMVYAGSRGQLADNPKRHTHENLIKIVSLAWWDAHLKDDPGALAWLAGNGVRDYMNGEATYRERP